MKLALVFAAVIVVASARTQRQGWNAPAPSGWNAPPPSGWTAPTGWQASTVSTADLSGHLAAQGQGWAEEDHVDSITASGDDGTPVSATVSSSGDAYVVQYGNDPTVDTYNSVQVVNEAVGQQGMTVDVTGLSAGVTEHGHSIATGAAASAAQATSDVTIEQVGSGWPSRS